MSRESSPASALPPHCEPRKKGENGTTDQGSERFPLGDDGETHQPVANPLSEPEAKEKDAAAVTVEQEEEAPAVHFKLNPRDIFQVMERKNLEKLTELGGVGGVADLLQTSLERGIDPDTIPLRVEDYGINELSKKEPVSFWDFLLDAYSDRTVQILCGAAVVSIVFGMTLPSPTSGQMQRSTGWINGTAIIISVIIVTFTSSLNNYQKAKQFEAMEKEQAIKQVQVIRSGEERTVMSNDVVVGDVMILEGGTQLDCDGIMIRGSDFKCNESSITGENDTVEKCAEKDPFFLSGSLVEEGSGLVLVVAVGMKSYEGRMKQTTESDEAEEHTPLQEKLSDLADKIGLAGFGAAILLVIALTIKEIIEIFTDDKAANAATFLNFFIIGVALVVVAIPEGLDLAVTIALAYSMKAMMADNCLVRVLASCETMGAATAICSDKTGTLTTNVMTVVQGLVAEEEFVFEGYGIRSRGPHVTETLRTAPRLHSTEENLERFAFALAINTTAREQVIDGASTWVGNKTERGLLGFVNSVGRNYKAMRESIPEDRKRQFPFNSQKKLMTTLVRTEDGVFMLYCKGASEILLHNCDQYLDREGNVQPMTPEKLQLFESVIEDMAKQGNRTIGVGFAPTDLLEVPHDEPSVPLVFMGVMGIQDPIREAVPDAVIHCNTAGLVVRMVTGDNINTAISIAKKCNIYHEGLDVAMEGKDFRKLYDTDREKFFEILPRLRILARSSPQDKYVLVKSLKEDLGDVVAVTGDGSNDAPALKRSNVGFAMNSGTDIAKRAADMVLLDDNFASVVNAIRWGRAVNDSIRKFLQFQLSINIGGVFLTVVGSLASSRSKEPFTAVQLLWLNLIMDTLASLALATERPEDASLRRKPVFKQNPLLSYKMWLFVVMHAVFQSTIVLLILFMGHNWFNTVESKSLCDKDYPNILGNITIPANATHNATTVVGWVENPIRTYCNKLCKDSGGTQRGRRCQQGNVHSTIIFNTFIFMQIFNIFNARKIYNEINPFEGLWTRSQMLIKVFGIIVAFQVFAVEVAGDFMQTTRIGWDLWLITVGLGAIELVIGFIPRLIPFKEPDAPRITTPHPAEDTSSTKGEVDAPMTDASGKRVIVRNGDPSLRRLSSIRKEKDEKEIRAEAM